MTDGSLTRKILWHLRFLYSCMVMALLALVALAPSSALAQSSPSFAFASRSYIYPFPQTDRYHLYVLGDYLASGLASGLEEAFEQDGSVKVFNSTKSSAGLARPDRTDWPSDIDDLVKTKPVHIAVLMMGINDIRNIRLANGVARWGSEEWRNAYADQADRLIKALKAKNIAVYWVGMPIMAKGKTSEAMALINDIMRERVYINGAKYIDSWTGFTDQLGGFAAYGPDLTGQNNRLRNKDGITFTTRGNRKLANYVEVLLRRDLAAARRERNISLAGDEDEQNSLVPKLQTKQDTASDNSNLSAEAGQDEGRTPLPDGTQDLTQPEVEAAAEGNLVALEELNAPEAPISVFASGYSPPGEIIIGDIQQGLTGLATVSPVTDLNANTGERRLPVTERLYYKALVKGEALEPKEGRADDFRWPRG